MSDFSDRHEPTPEFRAQLTRDIGRAYRSDERFGAREAPTRARRLGVGIGVAAGLLVALVTGMVVGASTSYASAAVNSASPALPRPALALLPMRSALTALGCAVAPAPDTAPAPSVRDTASATVPTVADTVAATVSGTVAAAPDTVRAQPPQVRPRLGIRIYLTVDSATRGDSATLEAAVRRGLEVDSLFTVLDRPQPGDLPATAQFVALVGMQVLRDQVVTLIRIIRVETNMGVVQERVSGRRAGLEIQLYDAARRISTAPSIQKAAGLKVP